MKILAILYVGNLAQHLNKTLCNKNDRNGNFHKSNSYLKPHSWYKHLSTYFLSE